MPKWTYDYFVYSFHCNPKAKIRISAIAQILQESAWMHAESFGAGYQSLQPEGLMWVLSGLKIMVKDFPGWGDSLSLNTWGKKYENLFAYRDFEVFDANTNSLKIQASSAWLLVDSATHRPQRITPHLQRIPPESDSVYDAKPGQINLPESFESSRELKVPYADIDVYNHVNNTKYIQWCIDSLDDYHLGKFEISEFEIRFVSEAHLNDEVIIFYQKVADGYAFMAKNKETDKEIFRAEAKISY
ncbi:MAG: hypothetical protein K9H49_08680 [Bacteroidales bacterium]|nr:hypothetical protein [Bacteroidales bacterium]MCF8389504.1 hypothetical protein [Bacteroidales bacterium]